MSEEKRWHDASVWEYEDAASRTLKEARDGGPVRKRGQFRYSFYDVAEPGKESREIVDYFSEDDNTVVIVGVAGEAGEAQRGKGKRVCAP